MEERKKTEENGIEWRVFERQDILFMECTDNGGGIDLTEILAAAAKQTIEARRNGTIESLNNTWQLEAVVQVSDWPKQKIWLEGMEGT